VTILAARPWFRYYADRLRTSLVEPELVSDSDLLRLLNEGYARLCEQSGCLEQLVTIPTAIGVHEYSLPSDWYQTLLVTSGGVALDLLPQRQAYLDYGVGTPLVYYQYGTKLGVQPAPSAVGALSLLYTATPAPVSGYDSDLDPRLPPEYRYGIIHYVRWRILQLDGGAQGIRKADYDRSLFDDCAARLRNAIRTVIDVDNQRMRTALEWEHAGRS
jgi:hypothetical protein